MDWIVAVTFILIQYCGFVFGDICYIDETQRYDYCDAGCCGRGYENNRRCCTETDVLVWIIVGSIVGGLLLISFIVAVVCCLIKSNGRKGMVVTPTYTANQTTTVYQVPFNPSAPMYPHQAAYTGPPAYMANPPPYSLGPPKHNQGGQIHSSATSVPYPQQPYTTAPFNNQPPPTTQQQISNQTGESVPPPPPSY